MKTVLATIAIVLIAAQGMASTCDTEAQAQQSLRAALAIEALSGGTPLTTEVHSLSSAPGAFGVILSYSGVQSVYRVVVEPSACKIQSVQRM